MHGDPLVVHEEDVHVDAGPERGGRRRRGGRLLLRPEQEPVEGDRAEDGRGLRRALDESLQGGAALLDLSGGQGQQALGGERRELAVRRVGPAFGNFEH